MQVVANDITDSCSFQFGTQIRPCIDNSEVHDFTDDSWTPSPAILGFPWLTIVVMLPFALAVVIWHRKSKPRDQR